MKIPAIIRGWRGAAFATVLLAILVATMTPTSPGSPAPFSFAITFTHRHLADVLLNVILFVPFGLTLGWRSRSTSAVTLTGFLLSTAIELTQRGIPGRDPSLSDIVFNTFGTLLGAVIARRPRFWLAPTRNNAALFAAASAFVAALIMMATAFLLSPAPGAEILIGRNGDDLQLRYDSRADAFGLDQPEYWLVNAFAPLARGTVEQVAVSRHRVLWRVSIAGREAVIGPTVGEGWAVLMFPDAIGRRWANVINALWLLALLLPVGFWTDGRARLLAGALLATLIAGIPAVSGIAPTTALEWVGAAVGFLAGGWIAESSRERLPNVLVDTDH
jgi:VanZ family protein